MTPNPTTNPLTAAYRDLKVKKIRVTVHTLGYVFDSDGRSSNHASIYLLTSDGNSVRLNMIKDGATATMGTLKLTHCQYQEPVSSVQNFDLIPRDGLTVDEIVQLLYARRRQIYKLAPGGVGCRFWVATLIADMEDVYYIHPSNFPNASSVRQFLQCNYHRGQFPELDPMVPGTFV